MEKTFGKFYAFLAGIVCAFDLTVIFSGIHISETDFPQGLSDLDNLKADMERIGQDFRKVMVNYEKKP